MKIYAHEKQVSENKGCKSSRSKTPPIFSVMLLRKKKMGDAYDVAGGDEFFEALGNMGAVTVNSLALGGGAVPDSQFQMERSEVSLEIVGHVVAHLSQTDPSNAVLVLEVEQVVHVCCSLLVVWLVLL